MKKSIADILKISSEIKPSMITDGPADHYLTTKMGAIKDLPQNWQGKYSKVFFSSHWIDATTQVFVIHFNPAAQVRLAEKFDNESALSDTAKFLDLAFHVARSEQSHQQLVKSNIVGLHYAYEKIFSWHERSQAQIKLFTRPDGSIDPQHLPLVETSNELLLLAQKLHDKLKKQTDPLLLAGLSNPKNSRTN